MEQSNAKIGELMKTKLDQSVPSITFNKVWNKHKSRNRNILGLRRVIAIPSMALIGLVFLTLVGFKLIAIEDKIDYPFINDQQVIGKWQAVDCVQNINDFNPDKQSEPGDLFIKALVFIKEGPMLKAFDGSGNLEPSTFTWTEGMVLNKQDKTASKYEIKAINGTTYMFLESKGGDYIYLHRKPPYFVLAKIDDADYSNNKLTAIEDKVDYPFVDDPQLIGIWKSVDFVKTIDEFEPGVISCKGDLLLTQFDIAENGRMSGLTSGSELPEGFLTWTQGLIIDKKHKTASQYKIKELKGDTYLFYEWKSGDYSYWSMTPEYYVLKKVK